MNSSEFHFGKNPLHNSGFDGRSPRAKLAFWLAAIILCLCAGTPAAETQAADYTSVAELFRSGKYYECREVAQAEVDRGVWNERWPRLLIRCQLTLGRYSEALAVYDKAMKRYSSSIPLRVLGAEIYRLNNDSVAAAQQEDTILEIVRRSPWRYSDKENLIHIGRFFLRQGEDAKKVLEMFFDRVRNMDPNYAEAYLATGQLALQKHDYALAAKNLDRAGKLRPEDPDIASLQSIAWRGSNPEKAKAMLERALTLNPNHIPSLLITAERAIDAERFEDAEAILTQILAINVYQPDAWAYHAVIAHLQGHYEAERLLRKAALARWEGNPQVDHLIGKKLSRHYRFAEGAEYQRRAIAKKETFVDAKFHLAQDLLRIGEDEAGWNLAAEVHEADGYNVVAHNLAALHDEISQFTTLEAPGLLIRMDAREARIYGRDVLELLGQARDVLTEKYDIQLDEPTAVEIFPRQKDFAIRTFGLPGGDGFLGVCFGRLVTANSPASQRSPSNWKAVLWHEYCHVVTLQKTNNRMPRWLSEGISVYEELEQNESWGQSMSPTYRQMILGDDLTPVSQLSSAFMNPKSGMHLQFAYYESSLVVRYIVDNHGFDVLKKILVDLGIGMPINEALTRYIGDVKVLDQKFAEYARALAGRYGNEKAWFREGDDAQSRDSSDPFAMLEEPAPTRFEIMMKEAGGAVASRNWNAALAKANEIIDLFPDGDPPVSVLSLKAKIFREQGDVAKETRTLEEIARRSSDAVNAYRRLVELAQLRDDWKAVAKYSGALLSVNPLQSSSQDAAAKAAAELNRPKVEVRALRALAEMQPIDPAGLHYRLATALNKIGEDEESRREVLLALEEAPRYRDAHKLLLKLVRGSSNEQPPPAEEDSQPEQPANPRVADEKVTTEAAAPAVAAPKPAAEKVN